MGKILQRVIQHMLVGYFVLTILKGVDLPDNYIYVIASVFLFSIVTFISSALLNFLTIKENFITIFLMCSLLSIGAFFLLEAFMPGFEIMVYTFDGVDTGSIVIQEMEISKILTMIVGGVSYSFISSMLNILEKSS